MSVTKDRSFYLDNLRAEKLTERIKIVRIF